MSPYGHAKAWIALMVAFSSVYNQREIDLAGIDSAIDVAYWFVLNYPEEREARWKQINTLLDARLLIMSGRYP